MRANYWTQFGAMAVPLGVSLIALAIIFSGWKDELIITGLISIAMGFFSFIAGWIYTIRDERRNDAKEEEDKQRRQLDDKRRQREHRENLIMLAELANRRGMSTPRLMRLIERLKQAEEEEEDEL